MIFGIIEAEADGLEQYFWCVLMMYCIAGFPATLFLIKQSIVSEDERNMEQVEDIDN